ncbi:hypothetical protein [Methylobacterium sp. WCS2018Hpa-22]|uniref:hypothetical protein n=1 Tax=Methylobacterium sp. WCS2018Hpa-22 TaxID=3073633 RepID=UPI00288B1F8A|nr:hypothetical protein [Methylobacterium sp. WCS2018Hpa-22]
MNTIQADQLDLAFTPEIPTERKRKPTGGARKPRSGVYVRSGIHVSRSKRTVEPAVEDEDDLPEHVSSQVSLPPITTTIITDALVGLEDDPKAQEDAETYIRQFIAYNRKQSEKDRKND